MTADSAPPPAKASSGRKKILIPLIAVIVVVGLPVGGCWYAGRLALQKALSVLNLRPELVEVKVGSLWALPLINRVYARDLVVVVKKIPGGPVEFRAGRVRAAQNKSLGGEARAWDLDFSDLEIKRGSGQARLPSLTTTAEAPKGQKSLVLHQGELADFSLTRSGWAGMSFDFGRLTFRRLGLGLPDDWTAVRRPLDWKLNMEDGLWTDIRLAGRLLGLEKETRLNMALNGHNAAQDWALALDLTRVEEPLEAAAAEEPASAWSGLMNRAKGKADDLKKLLEIKRLKLTAAGPWAEAAEGQPPTAQTELLIDLPGLYRLELKGQPPAPGRDQARQWAADCRRGDSGESQSSCLKAIGFQALQADYADQGLMNKKRLVRPLYQRFAAAEADGPLAGRLSLPLLGVALGLWLDEQGHPPGTAGVFDFTPRDGLMYPLRNDFSRTWGDGVQVDFSPAQPEPESEQLQKTR